MSAFPSRRRAPFSLWIVCTCEGITRGREAINEDHTWMPKIRDKKKKKKSLITSVCSRQHVKFFLFIYLFYSIQCMQSEKDCNKEDFVRRSLSNVPYFQSAYKCTKRHVYIKIFTNLRLVWHRDNWNRAPSKNSLHQRSTRLSCVTR